MAMKSTKDIKLNKNGQLIQKKVKKKKQKPGGIDSFLKV
jgi:hypothetical protein